jgi:hypothetical protein
MHTRNEATNTSEKAVYAKPTLVTLNSQDTAGGTANPVQEVNPNGTNVMRKMQSLGPPPS